ncbi:transposase [Pontibacter flavimaris]|uniref:transposase n=1 Tax=Pontibacter flavimaris TaxID=1797110 RepID=UPI000B19735D|nr:transposase [Pontibacter flavimaris]
MSRKYKIRDQRKLYFVSFSVVYWIDVFIREEYRQVLLDSLSYCTQHKGLEVYAYCIMTSHMHLIIGSQQEPLQNILRDFKSYTPPNSEKPYRITRRRAAKTGCSGLCSGPERGTATTTIISSGSSTTTPSS